MPWQGRDKLVVRRENPGRRRLFAGLALLVVVLALAAAYLVGERQGGYLRFATQHHIARLDGALAAVTRKNEALTAKVAFLGHSLTLAGQSASAVKAALAKQQGELVKLRQQLAFYRGLVVAPASGDASVRIAGLQLLPTGAAGQYRYQIVLVRADGKTSPELKGTCRLTVKGTRAGKEASLSLASLSASGDDPIDFTLRYFANLAGTLQIPGGFEPTEVDVEVKMHGDGSVSGSYSWPVFRG